MKREERNREVPMNNGIKDKNLTSETINPTMRQKNTFNGERGRRKATMRKSRNRIQREKEKIRKKKL